MAARIDGCGRFRQALYVTLPGIVPTIVILLILTMGSLFAVTIDKILLHPSYLQKRAMSSAPMYTARASEVAITASPPR